MVLSSIWLVQAVAALTVQLSVQCLLPTSRPASETHLQPASNDMACHCDIFVQVGVCMPGHGDPGGIALSSFCSHY